jgi:nucleoside-diphosphate-sugar epimerase
MSLLELVEKINKLLGTNIRPIHDAPRPGDVRHSQADISRAQADLGFVAKVTMEDGLRRCIDHLRSESSRQR